MWLPVVFVAAIVSPILCAQPNNCSSRNDGISISGGVCKADYGSRFNIDSKELMGTTCVSRNRGISKLLSSRLKQALDRMKQDFQQLQDLIDQEASVSDSEPYGPIWRSGTLNVLRDYQKEQKSVDKSGRYLSEPPIGHTPEIISEDENGQTMFNSQSNYFGQSRYPYDNSSKKIPDLFTDNRVNKGGINLMRRDPLSEYDPRSAYEQQRILADIRIEPEIKGQGSGAAIKEKNKYAEPEVPLPAIGLNPPNYGF